MQDPGGRVRWIEETARAVLEGRLSVGEGARAVRLQAEQTGDLLRRWRDSVTRREAEGVATRLRLYAEQVLDAAGDDDERDDRQELARALGSLAAILR